MRPAKTREPKPSPSRSPPCPTSFARTPALKGNRTAIVLAAALLEYARARDSCWPSNRRLAEDLGCCPQTIRNALATLQADRLGPGRARGQQSDRPDYLADLAGPEQATPPNRLDPPLKPAGGPPLKPVRPEGKIVVVEEKEEFPKFACERLRREIPPTPVPTLVTASPAPEPPLLRRPSRAGPSPSSPSPPSPQHCHRRYRPPRPRGSPPAQRRPSRAGPGPRQLSPYPERPRPGPRPSQPRDPPRRPCRPYP